MEIKLEINNAAGSPAEDAFFVEAAKETFAELDLGFLENKEISISVALVFPEEIRTLNSRYRQHDKVTDILSFAEHETLEGVKTAASESAEEELFLGELILCYDDIKEYAAKEGLDFERELAKVFSHGILHLMGFDHGEEMFAIQEKAAQEIISKRQIHTVE